MQSNTFYSGILKILDTEDRNGPCFVQENTVSKKGT